MAYLNAEEVMRNRRRVTTPLPALKQLHDEGNCRANEALDFYDRHDFPLALLSYKFLTVLNEFILKQRDVLFVDEEELFGVDTGNLSILFPAKDTVTFKYAIGENNFGAIGVTFHLVGERLVPQYIQVHDHTGFHIPRVTFDDVDISGVVEYAFSFMTGEDNSPLYPAPGGNRDGIMTYPLVDPRISLHPDNCDTLQHHKARDAFFGVLEMVKAAAPNTHSTITASWSGSHNIDTDVFRLRSYDYHSDDETLTWNFVWRDIAVQWYKHPGRSLTINRLPSDEEIVLMLGEISAAIQKYEFQPEPRKYDHPSANHHPEQIRLKLLANGIAGSHYSAEHLSEVQVAGALRARQEHKQELLKDPFNQGDVESN